MPEPGPDYYTARRRLWLTPRVNPVTPLAHPPARQKLEDLFNQPGAIYSPEAWNNGLEKVWKGLSSGGKLKYSLPMAIIIKIIHAAWLRDKTWPVGMEAPDSDDDQQAGDAPPANVPDNPTSAQTVPIPSITSTEVMETMAPWMLINRR
ncbi:hypothetical protein BDZ97DRAFT_245240 [Flammula alnicola]|nr:hypothetical protein BDZ97DRAFT_245240 [Flammula alnicola]